MYKLTALTKLILAIMISIASLITNDLYILSILGLIEVFTCFYLPKTKLLWSAIFSLQEIERKTMGLITII